MSSCLAGGNKRRKIGSWICRPKDSINDANSPCNFAIGTSPKRERENKKKSSEGSNKKLKLRLTF